MSEQINGYVYCECGKASFKNNENDDDKTDIIHDFKDLLLNYIKIEKDKQDENISKVLQNHDFIDKNFPSGACDKCGFKLLREVIPNGDCSFLNSKHTKLNEYYGDSRLCALTLAVSKNRCDDVKYLFDKYNVNPNGCNFCASSPIGFCIKLNFFDILKVLLDNNANPSRTVSCFNHSNEKFVILLPLDYCFRKDFYSNENAFKDKGKLNMNYIKIFNLLLKYGADASNLLFINDDDYYLSIKIRNMSLCEESKKVLLCHFLSYLKLLRKYLVDAKLLKYIYMFYTHPLLDKDNTPWYWMPPSDGNCLDKIKKLLPTFVFNESIIELLNYMPSLMELSRYNVRKVIQINNYNNKEYKCLLLQIDELSDILPSGLIKYLRFDD